ncbi:MULTISPECIES: histidine phosphatase family protein [Rhodococcus]|uniref:histidine phosphatase family protein n=1 Tax=Rhodococcus TaxID=1827 RepID=UPI000F58BA9E
MTLTSLNLEQAGVLAEAMREEVIDTLFSSALLRAQMTARPLARRFGLSVEVRSGLQEIGAGDLEMCSDADAHDRYLTTVFAWATRGSRSQNPGRAGRARLLSRLRLRHR